MFSKVKSAQTDLLKARIIDVEVDLSSGLYAFSVVGLPDKAVEEARDRVSAAIKNSGFKSPKSRNQKVVISLAPADVKKEGTNFDLAMALGYLLATGDLKSETEGKLFLGELSLDGKLRPIRGALPLVREAKRVGFREIFLPKDNAREAALIDGIDIYGAESLGEVVRHMEDRRGREPGKKIERQPKTEIQFDITETPVDFSDIKGQESAKRGLEIAAAGGHNVAMWGPPGTGKTMLARAFASILPPLDFEEMLEITSIHSIAGTLSRDIMTSAPIRSPHHTSSHISIVGGGNIPRPGEATLAHRGVLFMDEFPEFDRRVIEGLRQPLEDKTISISRARGSAIFPANFILIAAMNPCPCGNFGVRGKECVCTGSQLERYRRKISGPIIDRIDLWTLVGSINPRELGAKGNGEKTSSIRERVAAARVRQKERFEKAGLKIKRNSDMGAREIDSLVRLKPEVRDELDNSATRLGLSGRSYHRIIKLSRTIADLSDSVEILKAHLMEALQYRPKK